MSTERVKELRRRRKRRKERVKARARAAAKAKQGKGSALKGASAPKAPVKKAASKAATKPTPES